MKKIISLLSALAIVLTTVVSLTTVAFAENEQTLSCSVAYPVDMDGDTYVEVTVKASGFEYAKYSSLKKTYTGLTGIQFELDYDSEVLTYVAGIEGDAVSEPQIGETAPKFAVGKDVKYVIDGSDSVLVTFYFVLNEGFDINAQSTEIGFVANSVLMQLEKNDADTVKYGDHVEATTSMAITGCTLGTATSGPELVENDYVFSFRADQDTDVRITHSRNGDKTYDLPNFVEGAMEVWGLLKITEGADVEAGDTFKIETVKNRELIETIKTITVQAADLQ